MNTDNSNPDLRARAVARDGRSIADEVGLLEIGLLGGFSVYRARELIPMSSWQRRHAKTLIKLVATVPNHVLHREQIVELLWPHADLDSGLNSFGKVLHAARRALEPELPRRAGSAYLRLTDSMLVLDAENVEVDADQFEQRALAALRGAEVEKFESALSAYGGTLLPEDLYEDWSEERRNYLAELHVRLLSGLGTLLARRGALNEAADRLREALQHDPTREEIHRRLMRLYIEMGTPDLALRQFHMCEDALRRLLDLSPRPETLAVYEELIAVGPIEVRDEEVPVEPAPRRIEAKAPALPASTLPFVGREPILSRLLCLLPSAELDAPRLVFVSGEAGVGKTRLMEELASRARASGAIVLWGGVGAHPHRFDYGACAVALEAYAASRPEAERMELSRHYPALARLAPSLMQATPTSAGDPPMRGQHVDLIRAIVRLISDLSRDHPVLIVLGDLHDADEFTLDLIRYVAHLARHRQWLIVATVREEEVNEPQIQHLLTSTLRERLAEWIELECLSRADCDRLVRHMLPSVAMDDKRLQMIYQASRGNPVYVEALVRELAVEADGTSGDGAAAKPDSVSRRIRAAATMQLGMMTGTVRRVLELAALSPDTAIALDDLRAATAALTPPIPEEILFDVLDQALSTRILEEAGDGYAFRYSMVRVALRDGLSHHRRAQLLRALGPTEGEPATPQE